jgi:hypothetical protein
MAMNFAPRSLYCLAFRYRFHGAHYWLLDSLPGKGQQLDLNLDFRLVMANDLLMVAMSVAMTTKVYVFESLLEHLSRTIMSSETKWANRLVWCS